MEQHTDTAAHGPDLREPTENNADAGREPFTFGPGGVYAARLRHGRPGPKSDLDQRLHGLNRQWAVGRRIPIPDAVADLDVPIYLPTDPPLDPAYFDDPTSAIDHPFVFRRATLPAVYTPHGQRIEHADDGPAYVRAFAATFDDPRAWRLGRHRVHHRGGGVTVSTVFLGVDMNAHQVGPPILWETDIIDAAGEHVARWRYASRNAALHGHRTILAALRAAWATDRPGAPIRRRR